MNGVMGMTELLMETELSEEQIFEPFNQLDNTAARKHGGTGLGLTISKKLVELMGGKLKLDSKLGVGTVFSFSIPVMASKVGKQEEEFSEDNKASRVVTPLRILLAEDNRVNQKLAVKILEKEKHIVTVVENGKEAVAAFLEDKFDVVLMDIQMPALDGVVATYHIRALPRGADIPIVAMTAHAMKGDREKYLKKGMDGYITKPFRPKELLDILHELTTK